MRMRKHLQLCHSLTHSLTQSETFYHEDYVERFDNFGAINIEEFLLAWSNTKFIVVQLGPSFSLKSKVWTKAEP